MKCNKLKLIAMIIAPLIIVAIILGLYYGLKTEKYTSCTCRKDAESYTFTRDQPKTNSELVLEPANDFMI